MRYETGGFFSILRSCARSVAFGVCVCVCVYMYVYVCVVSMLVFSVAFCVGITQLNSGFLLGAINPFVIV